MAEGNLEMGVQLPGNQSFQNVPPEVLLQIHECLDLKSLLHCRAVSRQWTEIASSVSGKREDLEIEFKCSINESNSKGKIEVYRTKKEPSLAEFIELFGASENFPCARYSFYQVGAWTFSNPHWINFLAAFGENIKCLKFRDVQFFEKETNDRIASKFIENLSDLLLNLSQLPNLQEFGLQLQERAFEKSAEIPLFSFSSPENTEITENENPASSSSSKQCKEEKPSQKVQLPRLKILYLDEFMFSKFTRIVTDLLSASGNLRKIEPFEKDECYKSIESFHFLQSLGKLHCVKMAEMQLNPDFLSKIRENPAASMAFKLKRLNLSMKSSMGYKSTRDLAISAIFLSNLFESAKNSLQELTTTVVGGLRDLQVPNFSRLTKLRIVVEYHRPSDLFLPAGIQFVDIFPVLQTLELDNPWRTIFPEDDSDFDSDLDSDSDSVSLSVSDSDSDSSSVSAIPTFTTLIITGREMVGETIAQISARCPNLKNFKVKDGQARYDFPDVGLAIWTHLQKLESLDLIVDVLTPANAFPAVDSCITGFSREDVLRLYNLYQAEPHADGDGANLAPPNLILTLNRINPSILDLKDLKYFEIRLASYHDAADDRPESMDNVMNRIWEDYAFQFMDNLTYNIFGRR